MKCAKCGLDIPQGTHTCPKCGRVNEFVAAEPPRMSKPLVYGIAVLGLIALIAIVAVFAMRGSESVTSVPPGQPSTGSLTNVPPGQPSGGGLMGVPPGGPGPGSTTPPGVTKPKPPQAVVDYLQRVKAVEEIRVKEIVESDFPTELKRAYDRVGDEMWENAGNADFKEGDMLAPVTALLDKKATTLLRTLNYFDSVPAPPECREFSGAYRAVIYRETKTIYDAAAGINGVNLASRDDWERYQDRTKAMKDDPNVQNAAMDQLADTADQSLSRLVGQYEMPKPFDVHREQKTGGNIMGF